MDTAPPGKMTSSLADAIEMSFQEATTRTVEPIDASGGGATAVDPIGANGGGATAVDPIDATESSGGGGGAVAPERRLLLVANRLPLSIVGTNAEGEPMFKISSGGLVSALASVKKKLPFIWIGWIGAEIPEHQQASVRSTLLKEHGCVPVFVPDELMRAFYDGVSNEFLWPSLHHGREGIEAFTWELWASYRLANELFFQAVAEIYRPGDVVWVHDYHLLLLPELLQRLRPEPTVGFFLHTPFPSSDVILRMPPKLEIVRSLLACSLVGFHVPDYARHFLSAARRVVGASLVLPTRVFSEGHSTKVLSFPIGIDPGDFAESAASAGVKARVASLRLAFCDMQIVVSVDRLDPIKGVVNRLLGVQGLLRRQPALVGRVVFIQVCVPSRTSVPMYASLSDDVSTLVAAINDEFGSVAWSPIHHRFGSVDRQEISALYSVADVCLVSSLRDGMNLVAEEWVACTPPDAPGVLLLSALAGVAQGLEGALTLSPWEPNAITDAIEQALSMPLDERLARHASMLQHVLRFTSQSWASAFVASLLVEESRVRDIDRTTTGEGAFELWGHWTAGPPATSSSFSLRVEGGAPLWEECERILVVDHALLLSEEEGIGGELTLLEVALVQCARESRCVVVIFSQLGAHDLQARFGDETNVVLVAERGLLVRLPSGPPASGLPSLASRSVTSLALASASVGRAGGPFVSPLVLRGLSVSNTVSGQKLPSTRRSIRDVFGAIAGGAHSFAMHPLVQAPCSFGTSTKSNGGDRMLPLGLRSGEGLGITATRWKSTHVSSAPSLGPDEAAGLSSDGSAAWKLLVLPIFQVAVARTPGSHIVEEANTLSWLYEACEPDVSSVHARELEQTLDGLHSPEPLEMRLLDDRLEVRLVGGHDVLQHVVDNLLKTPSSSAAVGLSIIVAQCGRASTGGLGAAIRHVLSGARRSECAALRVGRLFEGRQGDAFPADFVLPSVAAFRSWVSSILTRTPSSAGPR